MENSETNFIAAMEQERRRLKLEAVEDCIRVKKQLAGFNIVAHQDIYTHSSDVFDKYWDMSMEDLHLELESLSAQASEFVQKTHWKDAFNNITIMPPSRFNGGFFRELGEDEQDKEE